MEIKSSTQGEAKILQIDGSLDGNTVSDAQDKIMPLLSSKMALVLDLAKCTYVSSAGLRLLLMIAKQLSTQESVLVLSGLSPEIKDVMDMTGFNNFFRAFDNVPEALEAMKKEGKCSG